MFGKSELEDILNHFLDSHQVTGLEKDKIITEFKKGEVVDAINKAFTWKEGKYGYNFYQFLCVRWIWFLKKIYAELDLEITTKYRESFLDKMLEARIRYSLASELHNDIERKRTFLRRKYKKVLK